MPALVFPPPGCENANQHIVPFTSFDITASSGGNFTNLLLYSQDLEKSPWYKGVGSTTFTGNYDVLDWYLQDGGLLTDAQLLIRSDRDGETFISSTNPDQFLGQALEVEPNQTYHFSFYAKRGSSLDMTYGVYDLTNAENIIAPTSYYSQTNQNSYSRIYFQCVIPENCTSIVFFPLWTVLPGEEGNLYLYGLQVESEILTAYNPTFSQSFAKNGIFAIDKETYGIDSRLEFFPNPDDDFEPTYVIHGQTNIDWNVEQWYIGDLGALTYSTKSMPNTLYFNPKDRETYRVGETITISSSNSGFRQNYTIVSWNKDSLTIDSTDAVPIDGAVISDAFPSAYDQRFVFKDGPPTNMRTRSYTPREAFYMVDYKPSVRALSYYLDREFFTTNEISSNFSFGNQKGKIGAVRDLRSLAKLQPRSNLATVDDRRLLGKLRPRDNLKLVAENRRTEKIDDFFTDRFPLKIPFGIPALSGINFIILSDERILGDVSDNIKDILSLEPYTIDYGLNPVIPVIGMENIEFDVIDYYTFDRDILTKQTDTFGATIRLYHAYYPDPTKIEPARFYPGHFIKITSDQGFSAIAEIKAATPNSVTIDSIPDFPLSYEDGIFIQNLTFFYHPKEKVLPEMIYDLRPYIVDEPKKSLAVIDIAPNYRAVRYYIDRDFSEDGFSQALLSTSVNHEYFNDADLDGDFRIAVTGQETSIKYDAATWYTFENNIIEFQTISVPHLILYFSVQLPVFFKQGDQLDLINVNSDYFRTITVVDFTAYSITIVDPLDFPGISGTFIVSRQSSFYPQSKVKTNLSPSTPRERLYYFNIAPGFKYNSSIQQGISMEKDRNRFSVEKLSSSSNLRETRDRSFVGALNRDTVSLREDKTVLSRVFKLNSMASLRAEPVSLNLKKIEKIDDIFAQSGVSVRTRPTNPREVLYYATLAPGFRSNLTIQQGRTLDDITVKSNFDSNTLQKPINRLITTLPLRTENLKSISLLRDTNSDISRLIPELVDKFTITADTTQIFDVPRNIDSLERPISRLITTLPYRSEFLKTSAILRQSLDNFPTATLKNMAVVVSGDRIRFATEDLNKSLLKLIDSPAIFGSDLIENLRINPDAVQFFELPTLEHLEKDRTIIFNLFQNFEKNEFLEKQLFVLRPGDGVLDIPFLTKDTFKLRNDSIFLRSDEKLTAAIKVETDKSKLNQDLIENLRISADTVQFFELPTLEQLQKDLTKVIPIDIILGVSKLSSINKVIAPIPNYLDVSRLSAQSTLKTLDFTFKSDLIDRFLTPSGKTQVLSLDNLGKLTASAVLKSDQIMLRADKLASSTILRSDSISIASDYNLADYFDQASVSTIVAPITPRERLYYFNIAPGFKYNSSIQQAIGLGPISEILISRSDFLNRDFTKLKPDNINFLTEKLSTFDDVGLFTGPSINTNLLSTDTIVPVTGRTSEFSNNVILWYTYDEDIIKLIPLNTPIMTLSFDEKISGLIPFSAGMQVKIQNDNNFYERIVTVLTGDSRSISFVDPGDLPSISGMTISRLDIGYEVTVFFDTRPSPPFAVNSYVKITNFDDNKSVTVPVIDSGNNYIKFLKLVDGFYITADSEIVSASVDIVPTDTVSTQQAPINSRERLYYTLLSPGLFGRLDTVFGHYLEPDFSSIITDFLEEDRDFFRELRIDLSSYNLEKSLMFVKPPYDDGITVDNILRYKVPPPQVELFFTVGPGEILRLKTGDFKRGSVGIRDVAAPKKEPIQFWN